MAIRIAKRIFEHIHLPPREEVGNDIPQPNQTNDDDKAFYSSEKHLLLGSMMILSAVGAVILISFVQSLQFMWYGSHYAFTFAGQASRDELTTISNDFQEGMHTCGWLILAGAKITFFPVFYWWNSQKQGDFIKVPSHEDKVTLEKKEETDEEQRQETVKKGEKVEEKLQEAERTYSEADFVGTVVSNFEKEKQEKEAEKEKSSPKNVPPPPSDENDLNATNNL